MNTVCDSESDDVGDDFLPATTRMSETDTDKLDCDNDDTGKMK